MRFLVDSGYALGDCAIDVALLRAIAGRGHHLEVLAGSKAAEMFVDCSFIKQVHEKKGSLFGRAGMYWRLFRQDWDVIIITRVVPAGKAISLIRCRHRLSAADAKPELFAQGAVLWRLSIVAGVIEGWDRDIDTSIPFAASRLAAAAQLCGIESGERYLTVAPGSGVQRKIWPTANFAEVVNAIRHNFDRVAVVGSAGEHGICAQLAQACGAVSSAGRISLAEACALVSNAALHLGNDSGLGHVAAGNGVPTLAVGEYMSPRHYVPWRQHMIAKPASEIETQQVLDLLHEKFNLHLQ